MSMLPFCSADKEKQRVNMGCQLRCEGIGAVAVANMSDFDHADEQRLLMGKNTFAAEAEPFFHFGKSERFLSRSRPGD